MECWSPSQEHGYGCNPLLTGYAAGSKHTVQCMQGKHGMKKKTKHSVIVTKQSKTFIFSINLNECLKSSEVVYFEIVLPLEFNIKVETASRPCNGDNVSLTTSELQGIANYGPIISWHSHRQIFRAACFVIIITFNNHLIVVSGRLQCTAEKGSS